MSANIDFCHLRIRSAYSFHQSIVQIPDLVRKLQGLGMKAACLIDIGTMSGTVEFYTRMKKAGLKPIVGVELEMDWPGLPKTPGRTVTLIARNNAGYTNLCRLVAIFNKPDSHCTEPIGMHDIRRHASGLIVLLGGQMCWLRAALLRNDTAWAEDIIQSYIDRLGHENIALEVQRLRRPNEKLIKINGTYKKVSEQFILPVVATQDVRFLEGEHFRAFQTWDCIHRNVPRLSPEAVSAYTVHQHLMSVADMTWIYPDWPEVIENTVKLTNRCELDLEMNTWHLPRYPGLKPGESSDDALIRIAQDELEKQLSETVGVKPDTRYKERLDHELGIIRRLGCADYFLILADAIQWARTNKIAVGPGRGSMTSSLVCYALGITKVDPLQHGLYFERFLNPLLGDRPFAELDVGQNGRIEIFEYLQKKYGFDFIAESIGFKSIRGRKLFKAMHPHYPIERRIVNRIHTTLPEWTQVLRHEICDSEELKEIADSHLAVDELFTDAELLESLPVDTQSNASVLIGNEPMTSLIPITYPGMGDFAESGLDRDSTDDLGILRYTFLELMPLELIEEVLFLAQQNDPEHAPESSKHIPLDDCKTYALIKSGDMQDIAFFNSISILVDLEPESLSDLALAFSIWRPWRTYLVGAVIESKRGTNGQQGFKRDIPDHPSIKAILKESYGYPIYQEQLMRIMIEMAGFSASEADIFRKALGKKKAPEIEEFREQFLKGALVGGYELGLAKQLVDLLISMSVHLFSKAHAIAYATIAYQTAWLKANYRDEFEQILEDNPIVGVVDECDREDEPEMVRIIHQRRRQRKPSPITGMIREEAKQVLPKGGVNGKTKSFRFRNK